MKYKKRVWNGPISSDHKYYLSKSFILSLHIKKLRFIIEFVGIWIRYFFLLYKELNTIHI